MTTSTTLVVVRSVAVAALGVVAKAAAVAVVASCIPSKEEEELLPYQESMRRQHHTEVDKDNTDLFATAVAFQPVHREDPCKDDCRLGRTYNKVDMAPPAPVVVGVIDLAVTAADALGQSHMEEEEVAAVAAVDNISMDYAEAGTDLPVVMRSRPCPSPWLRQIGRVVVVAVEGEVEGGADHPGLLLLVDC